MPVFARPAKVEIADVDARAAQARHPAQELRLPLQALLRVIAEWP